MTKLFTQAVPLIKILIINSKNKKGCQTEKQVMDKTVISRIIPFQWWFWTSLYKAVYGCIHAWEGALSEQPVDNETHHSVNYQPLSQWFLNTEL